jgi:heme A synthase
MDVFFENFDRIVATGTGILFMLLLFLTAILIIIRDKEIPSSAMFLLRVLMALAAAGFASVLPGLLNLRIGTETGNFLISASGALATFVLIYIFDPPTKFEKNFPRPKPIYEDKN